MSGLDGDVYRAIERDVAGRVAIDWHEVDLCRLAGASYTVGLSTAALFRILLPDLLPASRTRTIYLDADTLVRRPLGEIWRIDLDNHLLAAVRDAGAPFPAGPSGTDWRSVGLAPDTDYFNSGLMVLPLDRWRAEQGSGHPGTVAHQGHALGGSGRAERGRPASLARTAPAVERTDRRRAGAQPLLGAVALRRAASGA